MVEALHEMETVPSRILEEKLGLVGGDWASWWFSACVVSCSCPDLPLALLFQHNEFQKYTFRYGKYHEGCRRRYFGRVRRELT